MLMLELSHLLEAERATVLSEGGNTLERGFEGSLLENSAVVPEYFCNLLCADKA